MLKILETSPVDFGEDIALGVSPATLWEDIVGAGKIYCIRHCFHPRAIDALREQVFGYFSLLPHADFNIQLASAENPELLDKNHHVVVRGISSFQKTLHYFHVYSLGAMEELPATLKTPVQGIFSSLIALYNYLTQQHAGLNTLYGGNSVYKGPQKIRPQFMQYPVGGGMFAAHAHELEPQKLGFILGVSKRGRDYSEGGAGFEAPDGSIIDTSAIHDIGDIIVFRYNLKHWVTPCDITSAVNESLGNGRWTAMIPIY